MILSVIPIQHTASLNLSMLVHLACRMCSAVSDLVPYITNKLSQQGCTYMAKNYNHNSVLCLIIHPTSRFSYCTLTFFTSTEDSLHLNIICTLHDLHNLQTLFKLEELIPFNHFKSPLINPQGCECRYFNPC